MLMLGCQQIIYERTFLDLSEWLTGRRDLHTHTTNIWFSTSFEYFDIPLLRRCWITPCMRRSASCCVVLRRAMRRSASFCVVLRRSASFCVVLRRSASFCVVMQRVASRCRAFFHNVFYTAGCFFSLRILCCKSFFSQRFFYTAGRFSLRILCCKSFFFTTFFTLQGVFRCAFCAMSRFSLRVFAARRFYVVHFVLCRVFALCILCCVAFSLRLCVLCCVFASCFDTFSEPQPTISISTQRSRRWRNIFRARMRLWISRTKVTRISCFVSRMSENLLWNMRRDRRNTSKIWTTLIFPE